MNMNYKGDFEDDIEDAGEEERGRNVESKMF